MNEMKQRYIVYKDGSYDDEKRRFIPNTIKEFRHRPEAVAFVRDPKNARRYGQLFIYDSREENHED